MTESIDYGLRYTVRYLYDLQRLRIAAMNRPAPKGEKSQIFLSEQDANFLGNLGGGIKYLETEALRRITKQLKKYPISEWMLEQRGVGPTMAAVLISEVDIRRCNTVSGLWHYAGLSVDIKTNKAVKRKKGERITYNPFLRDKMLGVLAECFIKCNSPWRKFYDQYKHRKQSQKWGVSDLHRANAAKRYMIKIFLMELWLQWRKQEGLDCREPYCVQYLGVVHHA